MLKAAPALAILSGGLLLTGCQTAASNLRQLNSGIRVPEAASGQEPAEQQLATGRAALQQRNFAAAIVALRQAALKPDLAPASFNGLGVAYAGIGRADLAEQYFRRAISADPANPRYEENLARLYRTRLAAVQARHEKAAERERELAARVRSRRERQLAAGIRASDPAQRIVRHGPGMAMIVSASTSEPIRATETRLAVAGNAPSLATSAVAPRVIAVSAPGLRPDAPVSIVDRSHAPVLVSARREALASAVLESSAPVATAITATGRVYDGTSRDVAVSNIDSMQSRPVLRLASGNGLGSSIMGAMIPRQRILSVESLMLDNTLPIGLE